MSKIIDCPRCGEGDERPIGPNVCGLCECRFYVRPRGDLFVPDESKPIIGPAVTSQNGKSP